MLCTLSLCDLGSYQPSDSVTSLNLADHSSPPVDANVVQNADSYEIGTGLVFPSLSVGTAGADVGPNFTNDFILIVATLPDPGTLVILATSLAGIAGRRRRATRK